MVGRFAPAAAGARAGALRSAASYSQLMTTAVLLAFSDERKEFIDETHIHGYRDGELFIGTGAPGAGVDAEVVRTVLVEELAFAETCEKDDSLEDDTGDGPGWLMTWSDA